MIATLRNNHLPFAYVSISLFLSTSLNPLSSPPPSPPQKHLNKNLNFGPRTCLPSSVLAVAFETFPISNLGCIRAPLPACLVTIPIFMIRSSFPSIPSVAGRSCPDKAPPCIHFFLSIFFSLIIIFFPLHLLLLFYSPPPYRARSDCKYPISVRISFNPLQRQDSTIVQVWMSNSKN